MLKLVEKFVEKVADMGAGAVSIAASFQPTTPKCLVKDED